MHHTFSSPAALLFTMGFVPFVPAQAPGPVAIPPVHGKLFSGQQVDLPTAFSGRVGVLVVGFSQASRTQVTAWGRRLAADYAVSDRVLYFEMPVLAEVPRLLRGIVLGRVKGDVPQRAWPHFLPVTEHEAEWKSAVDFHDAAAAYVVVVDGRGEVLGRVEGDANETNYAAIKAKLEDLRSH